MAKAKEKGIDWEAAGRSGPTGANYLLAIAINAYEFHPKLSNCVRDAERLVSILQEKYGFAPEHTFTLFNQEATAGNMYAYLKELSEKVRPQDNVVIYFSGHSFYDRSDRTGHLVPADAMKDAVWQFFSNANLVNRIRAINSFHTFLIVDSCFSGSLFANKDVTTTALAEKVEGLPSRWALAAGQIEVVEDGLHGGHSPFAEALLNYLEANKSPLIPASDREEAEVKIQELLRREKEAEAWRSTQQENTIVAYNVYLEEFPDGAHARAARNLIRQLEREERKRQVREEVRRREEKAKQASARLDRSPVVGSQGDSHFPFIGGRWGMSVKWLKYLLLPLSMVLIIIMFSVLWTVYGPSDMEGQNIVDTTSTLATEILKPVNLLVPKPEMVSVKGGEFRMGDTFGDGGSDEKPVHMVTVSDFYIGKYEITFDEFDAFCEADGREKPDDQGWGRGRRPVIFVSWFDAVEYCNWVFISTGNPSHFPFLSLALLQPPSNTNFHFARRVETESKN